MLNIKPSGSINFQRPTMRILLAAPRITVIQIVAACVLFDWAAMRAGETEPAGLPNQENLAKQTLTGGQSLSAVQGRQHPGYQIFAHQLALSPITVIDKNTLDIGGKLRIDIGQTNHLSIGGRKTLAAEFEVPTGLVDKYLEHLDNNAR